MSRAIDSSGKENPFLYPVVEEERDHVGHKFANHRDKNVPRKIQKALKSLVFWDESGSKTVTDSRPYLKTHPWIDFQLDLQQLSPVNWVRLGECLALSHRIANIPLPPTMSSELGRIYLSRGISATTAIEGNTLSEEEVRKVLEDRAKIPPSRHYLAQEVQNMGAAYAWVDESVLPQKDWKLTRPFIENLNQIILDKLEVKSHVTPGEIRRCSVGVGHYRGAPWEDCAYLVDRLCEFVNQGLETANGNPELRFPISICVAISAHVVFEWIHPFGDGNGRTGRLLEATILLEAGAPDLAVHLLANFYNKTKSRYVDKLQEATKKGLATFLDYAVQGFRDELKEQMEYITEFQLDLTWHSYIDSQFRTARSTTDNRRRELALRLPRRGAVTYTNLLARLERDLYLGKSPRTLQRDLNTLVEQGLAKKTEDEYSANITQVLQFLPSLKHSGDAASGLRMSALIGESAED